MYSASPGLTFKPSLRNVGRYVPVGDGDTETEGRGDTEMEGDGDTEMAHDDKEIEHDEVE